MADMFISVIAEIGREGTKNKHAGVWMRMIDDEFVSLMVITSPWEVSTPAHKARRVALCCMWCVPLSGEHDAKLEGYTLHYFIAAEYHDARQGGYLLRRVDLTRTILRDPRSGYYKTTDTDLTLL